MATVELVLRLLLAGVFVTAGGAKLRDLQTSRETVAAFGVPARLADPIGLALPLAELACAVALLPTASGRWGALGALVLLVIFTIGVAYALARGRAPECNCFGQVSSQRISTRTLMRNAALIVVAAVAFSKSPGVSLSAWTSTTSAANLVAALSVLALGVLGAVVLHLRYALAHAKPQPATASGGPATPGLQPGDDAPQFELARLDGDRATLTELLEPGLPAVLVFASQACGPCHMLLPELVRWSHALSERIQFALVESSVRDPAALTEELAGYGGMLTLLDPDHGVAASYQAVATPTAVLIDRQGVIAAPQAAGAGNIEALVRSALNRAASAAASTVAA